MGCGGRRRCPRGGFAGITRISNAGHTPGNLGRNDIRVQSRMCASVRRLSQSLPRRANRGRLKECDLLSMADGALRGGCRLRLRFQAERGHGNPELFIGRNEVTKVACVMWPFRKLYEVREHHVLKMYEIREKLK